MSHGTNEIIYGSDERAVNLSDIYDLISAHRFPAMAGKPKWVILQACSGGNLTIAMVHWSLQDPYHVMLIILSYT